MHFHILPKYALNKSSMDTDQCRYVTQPANKAGNPPPRQIHFHILPRYPPTKAQCVQYFYMMGALTLDSADMLHSSQTKQGIHLHRQMHFHNSCNTYLMGAMCTHKADEIKESAKSWPKCTFTFYPLLITIGPTWGLGTGQCKYVMPLKQARQRQLTRPIPFSFSSNYHSTGPLVLHTIATTQPDIPRPALVLRTMLHGDPMWRYMQCTSYNSHTVTRCTPPTTIGCQLGSYTGYRLELFPIRSFYPPRQKLI